MELNNRKFLPQKVLFRSEPTDCEECSTTNVAFIAEDDQNVYLWAPGSRLLHSFKHGETAFLECVKLFKKI